MLRRLRWSEPAHDNEGMEKFWGEGAEAGADIILDPKC